MAEILSKTEFVVPIFKADGNPYVETDGKVILVYAKKGRLVSDPDEYPYTHWQVDMGNVGGNGLYQGSIANAAFTHQGNGIWTKDMATNLLETDNANREDNYFVFIGTSDPFSTATWTLVKGYDPKYFGTLNLPPKIISDLLSTVLIQESGATKIDSSYIKASLITAIELNTTHAVGNGQDHSSVLSLINNYDMDTILALIATNEDILNALADRLYSSTYLAEKIASLT